MIKNGQIDLKQPTNMAKNQSKFPESEFGKEVKKLGKFGKKNLPENET